MTLNNTIQKPFKHYDLKYSFNIYNSHNYIQKAEGNLRVMYSEISKPLYRQHV